jgi:hypothetical protein
VVAVLLLDVRLEYWGAEHQTEITCLPFVPICFSFLLHAAQRMQKAAKIKKKAVCRTTVALDKGVCVCVCGLPCVVVCVV